MGTRAAYGFRLNDKDKVTYNHYDGYLNGLGLKLLKQLRDSLNEHSLESLKKRVQSIVMVDEDKKPTQKQIEKYHTHFDAKVSSGSTDEWYCLLRELQGNISPYLNGSVKHMIESSLFMLNSLFCEWAYVINFDTGKFEVYRGFNKFEFNTGRYIGKTERDMNDPVYDDYDAVFLIAEINFKYIAECSNDELEQMVSALNTQCGSIMEIRENNPSGNIIATQVVNIEDQSSAVELTLVVS